MKMIEHLREWAEREPQWCRQWSVEDKIEVGEEIVGSRNRFTGSELDSIRNTLIAACQDKGWLWNIGTFENWIDGQPTEIKWSANVSCPKDHWTEDHGADDPFHDVPAFVEAYIKALREQDD